ncbi:MAG: Sulfur carrier protein CysO [Phycisphaerae bacterium]|nr:Sulfur carrier protein CysO [Phycisphaerae bacterium]
MAATVIIPSPLRRFTGGAHALRAEGDDVAALLGDLTRERPQLQEGLFRDPGRLQPFVHVFVNGRDIGKGEGLATPVPDGGEILIVQAISGG